MENICISNEEIEQKFDILSNQFMFLYNNDNETKLDVNEQQFLDMIAEQLEIIVNTYLNEGAFNKEGFKTFIKKVYVRNKQRGGDPDDDKYEDKGVYERKGDPDDKSEEKGVYERKGDPDDYKSEDKGVYEHKGESKVNRKRIITSVYNITKDLFFIILFFTSILILYISYVKFNRLIINLTGSNMMQISDTVKIQIDNAIGEINNLPMENLTFVRYIYRNITLFGTSIIRQQTEQINNIIIRFLSDSVYNFSETVQQVCTPINEILRTGTYIDQYVNSAIQATNMAIAPRETMTCIISTTLAYQKRIIDELYFEKTKLINMLRTQSSQITNLFNFGASIGTISFLYLIKRVNIWIRWLRISPFKRTRLNEQTIKNEEIPMEVQNKVEEIPIVPAEPKEKLDTDEKQIPMVQEEQSKTVENDDEDHKIIRTTHVHLRKGGNRKKYTIKNKKHRKTFKKHGKTSKKYRKTSKKYRKTSKKYRKTYRK